MRARISEPYIGRRRGRVGAPPVHATSATACFATSLRRQSSILAHRAPLTADRRRRRFGAWSEVRHDRIINNNNNILYIIQPVRPRRFFRFSPGIGLYNIPYSGSGGLGSVTPTPSSQHNIYVIILFEPIRTIIYT